jgi:hypothetical protein
MCSTKCATPLSASDSCRDPRVSQTPTVTDRTCGMHSVTNRSPESNRSETTMADFLEETGRAKP